MRTLSLCLIGFVMSVFSLLSPIAAGQSNPWVSVNDSVMGGISTSSMIYTDQGLRFSGNVSLENNGGFASVRRLISLNLPVDHHLILSVAGDGNTYQLRFRTERGFDGVAYSASFATQANITTQHVFTLDDFKPVWRGRSVPNRPKLTWQDVIQMGFMLSDKQSGEFVLDIVDIDFKPTI